MKKKLGDYSKYSDQELTRLLKFGDHAAYTEIYDRYNGILYIFALKRLQSREEAKDSIHELFLRIWSDHESMPLSTNLPAYLYTSLKNRIINVIVKQKNALRYIDSLEQYSEQFVQANTDHLVRHNELVAFIENEITSLHPRMRMVFELSRKTSLSRKEIALELGISEETVKSHMHGALKILKLKLGDLFTLLF